MRKHSVALARSYFYCLVFASKKYVRKTEGYYVCKGRCQRRRSMQFGWSWRRAVPHGNRRLAPRAPSEDSPGGPTVTAGLRTLTRGRVLLGRWGRAISHGRAQGPTTHPMEPEEGYLRVARNEQTAQAGRGASAEDIVSEKKVTSSRMLFLPGACP